MSEPRFENLPLEWVRAFEVAGRSGSFTAAARETGLTQAAISQRIGHLEARLGRPLFLRGARGVTLTVAGEAWLPYVTSAMRSLAESSEDLFAADARQVSIAASGSVTQLWLAPRLNRLSGQSAMQVSFTTMVVHSDFRQQVADVEVHYGSGGLSGREAVPLFREELCPVAAPALIKDEMHWHKLPRIAVTGPRVGWKEWSHAFGDPMTPTPHLRFDGFAAALAAALSGQGVLLASLPLCRDASEQGRLCRLSDHVLRPQSGFWMTVRDGALTRPRWSALQSAFCEPITGAVHA